MCGSLLHAIFRLGSGDAVSVFAYVVKTSNKWNDLDADNIVQNKKQETF